MGLLKFAPAIEGKNTRRDVLGFLGQKGDYWQQCLLPLCPTPIPASPILDASSLPWLTALSVYEQIVYAKPVLVKWWVLQACIIAHLWHSALNQGWCWLTKIGHLSNFDFDIIATLSREDEKTGGGRAPAIQKTKVKLDNLYTYTHPVAVIMPCIKKQLYTCWRFTFARMVHRLLLRVKFITLI